MQHHFFFFFLFSFLSNRGIRDLGEGGGEEEVEEASMRDISLPCACVCAFSGGVQQANLEIDIRTISQRKLKKKVFHSEKNSTEFYSKKKAQQEFHR